MATSQDLFRTGVTLLFLTICSLHCGEDVPKELPHAPPPRRASFSPNLQIHHPLPDSLTTAFLRRGENLLAFASTPSGAIQAHSSDNGRTWTEPELVNIVNQPLGAVVTPYGSIWYLSQNTRVDGGQYFLHRPDGRAWHPPVPLRDTEWGRGIGVAFAFDSVGRAFMVLHDTRDGNPDVYFSLSSDSGSTWSPNFRLNDDASGQEQSEPVIAASPTGDLCVVWADNRSEQTLFDLYAAVSTDAGKSWTPSQRINDDLTPTWQIAPSLLHDGTTFCVAWMDYRLPASAGDIRAGVYFSRWDPTVHRWMTNIRVNEVGEGNSSYPTLVSFGGDSLGALWMDPSINILNDIRFAYSTNAGRSWSPSVQVNDDEGGAKHYHRGIGWMGRNARGEHLFGWLDHRTGERAVFMAEWKRDDSSGLAVRANLPQAVAPPVHNPILYRTGEVLLRDDFQQDADWWSVRSGTWARRNGELIGYGSARPVVLAGSTKWVDYEFSGEFALDTYDHRCASVFVRAGGTPLRGYRISNYFRAGITLEYIYGSLVMPIEQVIYPIRKDMQYTFKAVVKGDQLDYYLNDSLCLSSSRLDMIRQGGIGLGSQAVPAYFRNIVVRRVE